MSNTITFVKPCPYCQKQSSITLNREDWRTYLTGAHYIQNVFVDLSPAERELIMTGICNDCWDKFMKDDESDDPYDDNYDYPEVGIEE